MANIAYGIAFVLIVAAYSILAYWLTKLFDFVCLVCRSIGWKDSLFLASIPVGIAGALWCIGYVVRLS